MICFGNHLEHIYTCATILLSACVFHGLRLKHQLNSLEVEYFWEVSYDYLGGRVNSLFSFSDLKQQPSIPGCLSKLQSCAWKLAEYELGDSWSKVFSRRIRESSIPKVFERHYSVRRAKWSIVLRQIFGRKTRSSWRARWMIPNQKPIAHSRAFSSKLDYERRWKLICLRLSYLGYARESWKKVYYFSMFTFMNVAYPITRVNCF